MPYVTSEGANIFVDVAGDGPPVLLVHGFGMHHAQWDPQWSVLADGQQAVRVDLRAHGRSETTAHGYTVAATARDLLRVLVQAGFDRRNPGFVVGHSTSADAVLSAAMAEPRSFRGVVLTAPVVWGHPVAPEWLDLWLGMQAEARAGRVAAAFERFRGDRIFDVVRERPELFESICRMHAACTGAPLVDDERDEGPSTLERVSGCRTPLLVLSGAQDREDFKNAARALAAAAPSATFHELAGAAHFPNLEVPAAFTSMLLEFMRAP